MKRNSVPRKVLALAMSLAFAASPAQLLASGFQLVEQNGSGLGNAFAGQAAGVKDASAVFFNPANMSRLPGKQFALAASGVNVSTTFNDGGSARPFFPGLPFAVPLGGSGGDAGGLTPVPSGYLSFQLSDHAWFGVGVNAPFGLKTDWAGDWMGRFHAVTSDVKTININPSLALKVSDNFSIGGGASYQRLEGTFTQSVAYGGIATGVAQSLGGPLAAAGILAQLGGPAGLAREGLGSIKGDDWKWGWNVGATVNFGNEGHLAATYRSKVKHTLEGNASFGGAPSFATTGALGALGAGLNARFADGPVTAEVELPDTLSLAASYESEKLEVLADWTRTRWSSIQDLTIKRSDGSLLSSSPLAFKDIWRVGFGLNYQMSEPWKLRLGTAYDKAPVQDFYRTPRLPDQNRIWAAAGVEYKLGKKGALDLGYAHLFIKDATSALPNQDTASSPPTGNLIGTYKAKVDIFGAQLRFSF